MDANGKASNMREIGMAENKRATEVVLMISGEEKDGKSSYPDANKDQKARTDVSAQQVMEETQSAVPMSQPMSCASPEIIPRFSPSPNKPPKIPTTDNLTRRKSLSRSVYSKPKSRFGEQSIPLDSDMFEEPAELSTNPPGKNSSRQASPSSKTGFDTVPTLKETIRSASNITPKTPLMGSPGGLGGEDDGEAIYKKVSTRNKLKYRRVKLMVLFEWIVFLCILGCLFASLFVYKLQRCTLWGLEIWKWCVLVMVTISGLFVINWFIHFLVLLIELNFMLRKKVMYFVHSLKKSVQVFIWLSFVLLAWVLLFKSSSVKRSHFGNLVADKITWTIVSLLVGTFLWVLKTLLLKILASSFHVNTFFDRIQVSIFHQYILRTLSGPPIMESTLGRTNSTTSQLSFRRTKGKKKEVIDIHKLHQMKQEKVSAWTIKMLIDVISNSGLSTISSALDETDYDGGGEQTHKEITNEEEAIAAAYHIFRNVAQPFSKYIDEFDLRRFMLKEEVNLVLPMIDVAETGRIDRKTLTDWVVEVYKGRKTLAHALNDTKTAVNQLNKLVTGILTVVIIIIWLLLVEIATTKVLVFLSSQIVVAAFMFGNTCKMIFEAIVFVFVMHPYDVGDRCVIDGVQMIVEEMNILTTVFLKFDNEKIYYPNSVLATKPISNFYRSPDMSDAFEFSIDFMTPLEKIGALKEKIKKYLEKNPQFWHPNHSVVVKEIENVNKLKMAVYFNHTMNFQNFGEKNNRRSELVLEMKKIFEELNIKYNLLPQEVQLVQPATSATSR